MKKVSKRKPAVSTLTKLKQRNKLLLSELTEVLETLHAIQSGKVDALVVNGKQGEQVVTLKGADEPYRILVENMNEGAVTLSSDGSIFYCNRRFSEYMRTPVEKLIGTSIFKFLQPDELDRFIDVFTTSRLARNYSDDFCFNLENDHFIPLRITMSSLHTDQYGVCMIATDLTQKNRQQEYAVNPSHLEKALEFRNDLISIASHELKTPLTTLLLVSQLQKKMIMDKDPRAFDEKRIVNIVDKTEAMANKLNILIDDMIDITTSQTGKMELSKVKTDLGELTKSVLAKMDSKFVDAGCKPPKFKKTNVLGNWDPARLEQVLNNLLVNAIKYGDRSDMEVSIKSREGFARLSITDKGIGVEKTDQLKIFSRFERAASASEISGIGLGLFISKKIIEAHDGTIWIESIKDEGSTFIFEIPTGLA